jgi:CBS domain-containing protein
MRSKPRRVYELRAADVMTSPGLACREDALFEEVAELLADREISEVPVVDARDVVVGVISERDLAHALGGPLVRLALRHQHRRVVAEKGGPEVKELAVKDVMTNLVVTLAPGDSVHEAAERLSANRISGAPDRGGRKGDRHWFPSPISSTP